MAARLAPARYNAKQDAEGSEVKNGIAEKRSGWRGLATRALVRPGQCQLKTVRDEIWRS